MIEYDSDQSVDYGAPKGGKLAKFLHKPNELFVILRPCLHATQFLIETRWHYHEQHQSEEATQQQVDSCCSGK
ncbi:hypothetical protein R50072_32340 [Simiduia litorea]